jgi:hypothetical protein
MKIIIAGSRDFPLYDFVEDGNIGFVIAESPFAGKITEVVSGGAKGPDTLGEMWAALFEVPVKKYPPDWDLHGKAAGPIRNKQMAEYADGLIAIWDYKSRGTLNMINNMKKLGKPVFIFPHKTMQRLLYT